MGRQALLATMVMFAGLVTVILVSGAKKPGSTEPAITIGGVIFTDMHDPLRSGIEGVTVTLKGERGHFQVQTGGLIGLWKLDVPPGTYLVTPGKPGYIMEHISYGGSDGQRSITIEVNQENLAANQSIQFLAIESPEANIPTAQSREVGHTGGGCAMASGRQERAGNFFAPYVACLLVLFVMTRADTRKQHKGRR
jgi:hypothetical protein